MKLAEAKQELSGIEERIKFNTKALSHAPLTVASQLLEESNQLIARQEELREMVLVTEEVTLLGGTALPSLMRAFYALDQKIGLLESVISRADLSPDQEQEVSQQLKDFRSNRETLGSSIQRCSWATELLE